MKVPFATLKKKSGGAVKACERWKFIRDNKTRCCKAGRKVLLGEKLCNERYVECLRDIGTPVSLSLVQAAAEGYLLGQDCTVLVEYGGHVSLTFDWTQSLLKRMGYVKIQQIVGVVKAHSIPPDLIINLDETGIKLVHVGGWSMALQGSKRVEGAGLGDKEQITGTFA